MKRLGSASARKIGVGTAGDISIEICDGAEAEISADNDRGSTRDDKAVPDKGGGTESCTETCADGLISWGDMEDFMGPDTCAEWGLQQIPKPRLILTQVGKKSTTSELSTNPSWN